MLGDKIASHKIAGGELRLANRAKAAWDSNGNVMIKDPLMKGESRSTWAPRSKPAMTGSSSRTWSPKMADNDQIKMLGASSNTWSPTMANNNSLVCDAAGNCMLKL